MCVASWRVGAFVVSGLALRSSRVVASTLTMRKKNVERGLADLKRVSEGAAR